MEDLEQRVEQLEYQLALFLDKIVPALTEKLKELDALKTRMEHAEKKSRRRRVALTKALVADAMALSDNDIPTACNLLDADPKDLERMLEGDDA